MQRYFVWIFHQPKQTQGSFYFSNEQVKQPVLGPLAFLPMSIKDIWKRGGMKSVFI